MIPVKRREQASDADPLILEAIEGAAIQIVRDALYQKYDVDTIFSLSGVNRPSQVLRWVVILAVYQLYERLPDMQMPDRIKDAHGEVLEVLRDIEDGKKSLELPVKNAEIPPTKFRWGSDTPRSHY